MSGRELFNHIMQSLANQSLQLEAMSAKQSSIERRIDGLRPQSYLPMIARPVQGVDYARTCNVAQYVDEKVKAYNSMVGPNAPRYLEFAENRSHDDLNRSALATIGGIMVRKLGDNYGGEKTWEKLYRKKPLACEEILEEARMRPELAVFAQVDGQWCLRELAKNKLKSIVRFHRNRSENSQMNSLEAGNIQNTTPTGEQVLSAPAENNSSAPGQPQATGIVNHHGDRSRENRMGAGSHNSQAVSRDHANEQQALIPILPSANTGSAPNNDVTTLVLQREGIAPLTPAATGRNNSSRHISNGRGNRRGTARRAPRSGLSSRNVRSRMSGS